MELIKPTLVHPPARANWYREGFMLTHTSFGIPAFSKVTDINLAFSKTLKFSGEREV